MASQAFLLWLEFDHSMLEFPISFSICRLFLSIKGRVCVVVVVCCVV